MRALTSTAARPNNLASTAGALVALVAIAAIVAGPVARAAPMEVRSTLNEAQTVRAVAAAVVAAARELVGSDRIDVEGPACHSHSVSLNLVSRIALLVHMGDQPILPLRTIGERLLDLPPPGR